MRINLRRGSVGRRIGPPPDDAPRLPRRVEPFVAPRKAGHHPLSLTVGSRNRLAFKKSFKSITWSLSSDCNLDTAREIERKNRALVTFQRCGCGIPKRQHAPFGHRDSPDAPADARHHPDLPDRPLRQSRHAPRERRPPVHGSTPTGTPVCARGSEHRAAASAASFCIWGETRSAVDPRRCRACEVKVRVCDEPSDGRPPDCQPRYGAPGTGD